MQTASSSKIRDIIRLVADLATTLLVAILIGTFTWVRDVDRKMVELDTNQRITMGSIEKMTGAVSSLVEKVAKLEGQNEHAEHR